MVNDSTRTSLEEGKDIIHTVYGNLLIEQKDDKITMRLQGEEVRRITVKDNQNDTYTMREALEMAP